MNDNYPGRSLRERPGGRTSARTSPCGTFASSHPENQDVGRGLARSSGCVFCVRVDASGKPVDSGLGATHDLGGEINTPPVDSLEGAINLAKKIFRILVGYIGKFIPRGVTTISTEDIQGFNGGGMSGRDEFEESAESVEAYDIFSFNSSSNSILDKQEKNK